MTTSGPDQPSAPKDLPGFAAFAGMGLSIAVTVGAFVALGLWVDAQLGSAPWGLIAGIALGCVAAVASTVALMRRYL